MEIGHLKYMKIISRKVRESVSRVNVWLVVVLFIATVLRVWNLGVNPPHLTPDEASLGYNAYSILKTGKDEHGKVLPIIFKSFGDYKPGLYVYATVPFVATLGLTELAVRLPSAAAGIVAVWLLYEIVGLISTKKNLNVLSGLILATSPWHIHFSRGAWEVNLSLTLTLLGIYFFLKSFKNNKLLPWSVAAFTLTMSAYQGAKLSTLVVVLLLLFVYWKEIIEIDRKIVKKSILFGFMLGIPVLLSFFSGKVGRLGVFSVFSYPRPDDYLQSFLTETGVVKGSLGYYTFYSESLNFLRGVLGRFFNHFSGRFLFFEGDWQNARHSAPNHGVLQLADAIFLVVGIYSMVIVNAKKEIKFIWWWLALSVLPSILSRDGIHAVRSFNMVIPLSIISAYGASTLLIYIGRAKGLLKISSISVLTMVYVFSTAYFLDSYFVHLPRHDSQLWEYGYKQVVETILPIQGNFETIKVRQSFAQPYIYFLFYGASKDPMYSPANYQKQANLVSSGLAGDVGYVEKIGNIEFVPIDWSVNRGESNTLFVADPVRIPPEDSNDANLFNVIKEIKYLNNLDIAFRIVEVK